MLGDLIRDPHCQLMIDEFSSILAIHQLSLQCIELSLFCLCDRLLACPIVIIRIPNLLDWFLGTHLGVFLPSSLGTIEFELLTSDLQDEFAILGDRITKDLATTDCIGDSLGSRTNPPRQFALSHHLQLIFRHSSPLKP